MTSFREDTFLFQCGDARLVGITAAPVTSCGDAAPMKRLGVLIVVGGPQYRVGSHRQFVLLSRALASSGFVTMRFDCAGMGDSEGFERPFSARDEDIAAAVDAFVERTPSLTDIVIWGLCDAASAALLYAAQDPRVRHLVLLNPWVRSEAGLARTHLKHYYASRIGDPVFWRQLLAGRIGVLRALAGLAGTLRSARGRRADASPTLDFQARMARGWKRFRGDMLLVCSGDDLTAKEFIDHAEDDREWSGLLDEARVTRCSIPDADHTFSRAVWRDRVAAETIAWLNQRVREQAFQGDRPDAGATVPESRAGIAA